MLFSFYLKLLALSFTLTIAAPIQTSSNTNLLPVHSLIRSADIKFENLAIRANGQILTTTTFPIASVYQVDPLGILPCTLIYELPNITSACGIAEGSPNLFYIVVGDISLKSTTATNPQSYAVIELDVHGVFVLPNGSLSRQPIVRHVASLPHAILVNGAAFAGPNNLLVADTYQGLIWNVNIHTGIVGVTLNDTATKGTSPNPSGPTYAGINGIKVHNGTMYWTNTGASTLYRMPVNKNGTVPTGAVPMLVTSHLTCDDLAIDSHGNAYVAGPLDVITKVSPSGKQEIIAGTFNSTTSSLIGPTAIRFGRMVSDQWSIYVTTNGGLSGVAVTVADSAGVSRIDLGDR